MISIFGAKITRNEIASVHDLFYLIYQKNYYSWKRQVNYYNLCKRHRKIYFPQPEKFSRLNTILKSEKY